jgi:hypothetical protein
VKGLLISGRLFVALIDKLVDLALLTGLRQRDFIVVGHAISLGKVSLL